MRDIVADLSRFNNAWYRPGGLMKRAAWCFAGRIFLDTSFLWPQGVKRCMLRLFGARIGRCVVLKPNVRVKYPWFLTVGDFSWIGEHVWIDNLGQVSIGANCVLSQGCLLLCGNHNYKKPAFDLIVGEIVLEDGVWIGAKASVCPGVVCRSHSVLCVGSVATRELEPYFVYQGNPAAKVRERK